MARPAKKQRAADTSDGEQDDDVATDYSGSPEPSNKKQKGKKKATAATKGKGKAKGKGKKRKNDDDDSSDVDRSDQDSEDDENANKGKELSEAEKKEHVTSIVRYVLFNETHRRILKREDIVKNVLTDGRGRHFTKLMSKVQKVLREYFGMDLVLLRAKESSTAKSQPKAWLLRSTLPQPLLRYAATHTDEAYTAQLPFEIDSDRSGRKGMKEELGEWMIDETHLPTSSSSSSQRQRGSDDDDEPDKEDDTEGGVMRDAKREEGAAYGLLGTILALILVNGKVLGDDQLISYLRRLNVTTTTPIPLTLAAPNPEGTTLATFLTNLVKQQYLERTKTAGGGGGQTQTQGAGRSQAPSRTQRATAEGIQESGDPSVEWRWGARAEAEIGEEGIGRFVQYIFENGNKGGGGGKRGKTGEKFMTEVARAAGVKKLQRAEDVEGGGFS